MSKREVLSIALKLMGIYFILNWLLSAPIIFSWLSRAMPDRADLVGPLVGLCISLGIPLVLITRSDGIAGRLAGEEEVDSQPPAVDRWGVQYVAFTVLGLHLALKALGLVAGAIPQFLAHDDYGITGLNWYRIVGPSAMLLVGLWLLFGSQALVELVKRARNAGHPKPD